MPIKTEAYANRQNEGVALPQKERIGQVGTSSDYGADNLRANDGSIQLQLSCVPKLWNARESRLNGKSREAVTTNGKLERLLLSAQSAYQTLCERGIVFTATDIKELLQGSMQSQITFLERYDQMLEEMKQKVGIEIKATAVKDFLFLTRKIDIDNNIVNDPFCKGPLTIPSLGDLCTEVSVSFE